MVAPKTEPLFRPRNSFQRALSPLLVSGQFFALMPVSGVTGLDASTLRFRWWSFRVVYTFLSLVGTAFIIGFSINYLPVQGFNFTNCVGIAFFSFAFVVTCTFLHLATKWSSLSMEWQRVEEKLWHCRYSDNMVRNCRILTAFMLTAAAWENVLSVWSGVLLTLPCSSGGADLFRAYYSTWFQMVFQFTGYTHWKAALLQAVNMAATFCWSFMDMFLILVTLPLVDRFRQFNASLAAVHGKVTSPTFWRRSREDFDSLSVLTRRLDTHISHIVLLCFANDLYYVCVQLLNTVKDRRGGMGHVYFFYSFGYLLLRTCAMALCASAVNDESKKPKWVLFSVPSESHNVEVDRFLLQVLSGDVALTGYRFFCITRGLLLTIVGSIVTYEVLLVQLNPVPVGSEVSKVNTTIVCY